MTGVALIIAFVLAIIVMIVAISKFKVHPFLAIMAVSLILAMMAGIPFVDTVKPDGTKVSGIPTVIGAGFSGTFSRTLYFSCFYSANTWSDSSC